MAKKKLVLFEEMTMISKRREDICYHQLQEVKAEEST